MIPSLTMLLMISYNSSSSKCFLSFSVMMVDRKREREREREKKEYLNTFRTKTAFDMKL